MSVRLRSAVAVAAVVASCVVGWSAPPALADATTPPTVADAASAPDEVTASEIAQAYGHDVVVSSEESPTVEIVAQPDGQLHMTQNTEPVRVQQAGGWQPIDMSLNAASGVVKPQTPLVPVEFSAGGAGQPLARIETPSGQWVSQTWKLGALPTPTLTDDAATYADVLPDVDLKLTATPTGMSEVLVIKNAAAAANPDLSSVPFGVDDGDLTTTQVSGGTSLSKSADGSTQVAAPAPTWWDSSSSGASSDGPGGLGVPSPVPDSVTSNQVTLDASAALAARPDVTYPAYIDPDYNVSNVVNWAFVDSAYPTTAYWHDSGASDPYQHVGYIDAGNSDDGRSHTTRSYWAMDTSFLHGRLIQDAYFNVTEVYSYSCTPSMVELWTTGVATPSSTWNAQPGKASPVTSQTVAHGYNSSCPASAVGFPLASTLQRAADASADTINLGLFATNESDDSGWKKFASSANMQVWFDTKPTQPAYRSVSGCAFICGMGAYTKDNTPTLTGAADDADPDQLRYKFELYAGHSGTPGSVLYSYTGPYVAKGYPDTSANANGKWTTPALADGDYEYRVQACDSAQCSDWSGYLTFTVVHTRRPTLPTITLPANGPISTDKNSNGASVGLTTETVTITPAASSNDPVYAYSYNMFGPVTPVFGSYGDCSAGQAGGYAFACGGLGSGKPVTITPVDDTSTFAVAVWDAAGNEATDATSGVPYVAQTFYASADHVTPQNGHQWVTSSATSPLPACTSSSALADVPAPAAPAASDMTVAANHACWGTSTVQSANGSVPVLSFDGNASTVSTGSAPHLVDTSKSFTVGAWVNVASGVANNSAETFLDQEGTNESAFFLQFVKDAAGAGHFSFCLSNSDATAYVGDCVLSGTPTGNTWYYVAAEWDSVNHQMRLFVSQDGTTYTPFVGYHGATWNATASARLGVDRIGSTRRYFKGMLCDPYITSGILDSLKLSNAGEFSLQAAY